MKALKAKRKKGKYKPEATPSTTIFRKGSASSRDDLTLLSVNASETSHSDELKKSHESLGGFGDVSGCGFYLAGVAFSLGGHGVFTGWA